MQKFLLLLGLLGMLCTVVRSFQRFAVKTRLASSLHMTAVSYKVGFMFPGQGGEGLMSILKVSSTYQCLFYSANRWDGWSSVQ